MKIGITGGIGSGKTMVCKVFSLFGIAIFNADEVAKNIIIEDFAVRTKIVELFGVSILSSTNLISRELLAAKVFSNENKLKQLNAIIHPVVANKFDLWATRNTNSKYVLKESAILFESNSNRQVDKVITIVSPLELRIKRSMHRGMTKKQVKERIAIQLSDEEKIKRSDFIIYNNEERFIIPQVLQIHGLLNSNLDFE